MDTVIYRKADRLIAAYVYPRRTNAQTQEAVTTEINNVCQSELGGVATDYAIIQVEHARQPGFQTVISKDGTVRFTKLPPTQAQVRIDRIREILTIPRSTCTTDQRAELLELVARNIAE